MPVVDLPAPLRASVAKRELILVVGSGASIAATGERDSPASWRGLLAHGIRYARDQGLLKPGGADAAAALLDEGEFSAVAALIKGVLQNCRADWLADAFDSLKVKSGNERLHLAVAGLPASRVITTNYDDLLEQSLGRAPVAWTSRAFATALSKNRHADTQILHVHGYYTEDPSVVIDQADYERLERDPAMDAFRVAAARQSLLFVGCGPDGLKDPHFSHLWRWLDNLGTTYQHYAFLPASLSTNETRSTTGGNVRFLRYDDSGDRPHDALPEALEDLAASASVITTHMRGVGRAAVKAPRPAAVERRLVVISAQDFRSLGLTADVRRPELRANLLERLLRLLARETRGADLCIIGTPLERDIATEVARTGDAPVLTVTPEGALELIDIDGTTRSRWPQVLAAIDFPGGLPTLTEPTSAPASLYVLADAGQLPESGVGICLGDHEVRLVAASAHWANDAPAKKARDANRMEVAAPANTDVVLTFDAHVGATEGETLHDVTLREVVYGLDQARFASLSRVVEGTTALTEGAASQLRSALEGLDESAFAPFRCDLADAEQRPGAETFLRHIAAPTHFRSAPEAVYEAIVDDTSAQRDRLRLLPWIRPTLRRAGDASAALASDRRTGHRLLVAASLGEFNIDRASSSFPRQRTLLAFAAEQRLRLTYTLLSRQSEAHRTRTDRHFLIHCFAPEDRGGSPVAESQSAAAALQSTFHNNYNLNYSTAVPADLRDADVASGEAEGYSRAWIVASAPGWAWPVSDYGFIGDYIRTLPGEVAVTWECSGDLRQVTEIERTPAVVELATAPAASPGMTAFEQLRRLASDSAFTTRNIALRCSVSVRGVDNNAMRLAHEVGTLVGTEVFGAGQFTIHTGDDGGYTAVSIGHALLAMHAPFGEMYATSFDTGRRYVRPLKDQRFEPGITLGTASRKAADRDYAEPVTLSEHERFHHVHVVGRPGVGKTTLLKQMIRGDLTAGNGVTVVDPHGGLADWVVANVPGGRADDLVLIDLDNQSHAPVLNLLDTTNATSDDYDRVVSEIIHFIRLRNYHEWSGPVFEQLVRLALLSMRDPAYPVAPAITELPLLLGSDVVRRAMEQRVNSEDLRDGWRLQGRQGQQHFAELLQWAISKFDELTKDPTLRAVLGGEQTTLNLPQAVREGKILIFRLASSRISEQASDFIGSMLLTALQQGLLEMAASRERPPHFVYIDEFHRFATLGLERLVVEARKFRVGMTLAHQNLAQLSAFQQHTGRFHEGVSSTLVGNAGTIVVFPVSSYDRDQLARELGCASEEIGRLARFQALVRTAVTSGSIQPFTVEIDDMGEPDPTERMARLFTAMRGDGIWRPIAELLDTVAERHATLRRWAAEPPGSHATQMAKPPFPTPPMRAEATSFLDEWLAKRQTALRQSQRQGAADAPAAEDGTSTDEGPTAAVDTSAPEFPEPPARKAKRRLRTRLSGADD